MLENNQKAIEPFLIRGRHEVLECCCLSQVYFGSPKRTKRNISNKNILLEQLLEDAENIYINIAGIDLSYIEVENHCTETCKEDFN